MPTLKEMQAHYDRVERLRRIKREDVTPGDLSLWQAIHESRLRSPVPMKIGPYEVWGEEAP